MAVAKGKVCIGEYKLINLLGLDKFDEVVEIVSVEHKMGEGLEFKIISKNPIVGLTSDVESDSWDNLRRIRVPMGG